MFPLIIILPLIFGVLCSVISYGRLVWSLTLIVSVFVLISSVYCAVYVYEHGSIVYHMGGWPPPYGIEFRIDLFSSIFLVLISAIATATMPYALVSIELQIPKKKVASFYTCFLLCFAALLGMVSSNDIFNIYVFLELSSLASYSLIGMGKGRAAHSAFEYLIAGTVGATFYLFGVGLLYMITGTLNISDLQIKLVELKDSKVITLGMISIFTGLSVKAALFPFYKWMIGAYSNAPCYISVFFSAVVTKTAIYLMIRLLFSVFKDCIGFLAISDMLHVLSLCAIVIGALFALRETNIMRVLTYSSVSQIGYIMLSVSLNSPEALTGGVMHLIFHSIAKSSLFMLTQLKKTKFSMGALIILSCSMIGVPVTAGFVSKWYIMSAVIKSANIFSILAMMCGSVMTFLYMWRSVVEIPWQGRETNKIMLISPCFLIAGLLVLGVCGHLLFDVVHTASTRLFYS